MRHIVTAAAPLLLLAACGGGDTDEASETVEQAQPALPDNEADTMASNDPAPGESARQEIPDPEERPIMQAQVVLDRQGFGPGVIDGKMGMSTKNALEGFQEARGLNVTGELDEATKAALAEWDNITATRVVTIPEDWGAIDYVDVPDDPAEQAKLDRLGYESLDEKLAERFHTTVEVLRLLNPGGRPAGMGGSSSGESAGTGSPSPSPTTSASASRSRSPAGSDGVFHAGQMVRVPNIGADRIVRGAIEDEQWKKTLIALGVGSDQPDAARIVVDRSGNWLKAYDAQDNLIATFTVTTGSEHDPLPLGEWGITGVGHNPPFSYDPDLFWDVPDSEEEQQLPPGPNGPVGVVWIDLTKEHYGIHGTSAPETIGRAQSHGCVRLTNWDAARLAQMVSQDTDVIFQA